MVEITQELIQKGARNRPGYPMKPAYLTIHNTGNSSKGANAAGHVEYIKSTAAGSTGWHYTVDDKQIIQHLPITENAWHAGDGTNGPGNRTSVGIEICENADGDLAKAEANAQDLVCKLLIENGIPLENVVPHKNWTGKDCPHLILPHWDQFIAGVKTRLDAEMARQAAEQAKIEAQKLYDKIPEWARPTLIKLHQKGLITDPLGDQSFYRIVVVLDRMGLFEKLSA
ncbi:peptidoglycan recognition protein family protein [Heliophilum fasciatum]|uniref:N-acetylmuramoyl-L-alanine amidase n=1 Tax=Heliophilum fasciatum TaxID=35700 RepID=A0A4R2RRK9_9FIRM|nr:N-acetylmuramoyl-L-alanine amidase [Heliophilum fasciatum]MCW2278750.1 N-acetylmuramoyl-L-alanine amidase [Heliophilum fasciatum]TCP62511.1 N-acetylmuramoyl-L-alanine amidase [Heliophilum fasciatum]